MNTDWMASLLLWSASSPQIRDATVSSLVVGSTPARIPAKQTLATFTALDQAKRALQAQQTAVVTTVAATANAVMSLQKQAVGGDIGPDPRTVARNLLAQVTAYGPLDDATIDLVLGAAGISPAGGTGGTGGTTGGTGGTGATTGGTGGTGATGKKSGAAKSSSS
jgi:hypothetical protein